MSSDKGIHGSASSTSTSDSIPPSSPPRKRGFAAMDPERVKAIASKGGVAAHAKGTAHQFSTEEAKRAGRKGGTAFHKVRGRGPTNEPASEK